MPQGNKPLSVVHLNNADFASGTYRILKPARYVLDEDIIFDPIPKLEAKREDKPAFGWFSVISVETRGFIIDLNTHSIDCSQQFVDHHYVKMFSIIILNNTAYGGQSPINQRSGLIFDSDKGTVSARSGIIANGRIGRSPHFGIKGFYNKNIILYRLDVEDSELAGIWLTSPKELIVEEVRIRGNLHPIRVTSRLTSLFFLQSKLQEFAEAGIPKAAENLELVNELFEEERILESCQANSIPDHTVYGLMIANGFRAPFPTFIDHAQCKAVEQFSKSYPPNDIKISDLFIENLTNKVDEVVGLGTASGDRISPSSIGLFGTIRYEEFFAPGTDQLDPSPFLRTYLYTIKEIQKRGGPQIVPIDFIDGVLDPQNPTFNTNLVMPIFGNLGNINTSRGIFGASIYCPENLQVEKIRVRNIQNISSEPLSPENISCLALYPYLEIGTRTGPSSLGILLNNVKRSKWESICIRNVTSQAGRSFGIHISSESQQNHLSKINIRKIVSLSPSLGVFFQDRSFKNTLSDGNITRIDIGIGSDKTSKDNKYIEVFVEENF